MIKGDPKKGRSGKKSWDGSRKTERSRDLKKPPARGSYSGKISSYREVPKKRREENEGKESNGQEENQEYGVAKREKKIEGERGNLASLLEISQVSSLPGEGGSEQGPKGSLWGTKRKQ